MSMRFYHRCVVDPIRPSTLHGRSCGLWNWTYICVFRFYEFEIGESITGTQHQITMFNTRETMRLEGIRVIVRDAPFGQLLRYATKNRVLKYPEELEDFECPHSYDKDQTADTSCTTSIPPATHTTNLEKTTSYKAEPENIGSYSRDLERVATAPDVEKVQSHIHPTTPCSSTCTDSQIVSHHSPLQRNHTEPYTQARLAEDIALHKTRSTAPSHPITPIKTSDGLILVDWYSITDPSNPQNCKYTATLDKI